MNPIPVAARDTEAVEIAAWRELMAITIGGSTLYRDDGEMQDNSVFPHIDFKRDTPFQIYCALTKRARAALAQQSDFRGLETGEGPTAHAATENTLRQLLEFWAYEGRLQTFQDRERFRAEVRTALDSAATEVKSEAP